MLSKHSYLLEDVTSAKECYFTNEHENPEFIKAVGGDGRTSDIEDKNDTNVSANMLGTAFSSRASLLFDVKRERETPWRDCIERGRRIDQKRQPKPSSRDSSCNTRRR
jgi:hypothetical protein